MKYGVFNPKIGQYTFTENKEKGIGIRDEFVNAWVEENYKEYIVKGQYLFIDGWMAYFYCAYTFMCSKLGIHPLAIEDIEDTDALNIFYTHSVHNLDVDGIWSRTFGYIHDGHLWHIKVRNGEVTDWYIRLGKLNGVQHEWISFNLNTGLPIEIYDLENDGKPESGSRLTGVLTKTNLLDPAAPAVITTFASYDEIPSEYKNALIFWPDKNRIISWANKSYGRIVEYKENIYKDRSEWPQNMKDAMEANAKAEALKYVTCVAISIDELDHETWSSVNLTSDTIVENQG